MDSSFLKPYSTSNSQTIPDESVTCIAVKEDRHQNMMCSVVLKKGVEERWASESAKIHQLVGVQRNHVEKRHRAGNNRGSRNRVLETCNAEVTSKDAVKGDKPSNGLVGNAVMLLRVPRGELHSRRTQRRLPDFAVVGGTCGEHFVQVPEGSRWSDAI